MILILVGSSGSGKSTLEQKLINDAEMNFKKLVTVTTRLPREGEQPGKDYYFMEKPWVDSLIKNDILHDPKQYGNNYYAVFEKDSNALLKGNSNTNYVCVFTADKAQRWKQENPDDVCIIKLERSNFNIDNKDRCNEVKSRTSEDECLLLSSKYDYVIQNDEGMIEETYSQLKSNINEFMKLPPSKKLLLK